MIKDIIKFYFGIYRLTFKYTFCIKRYSKVIFKHLGDDYEKTRWENTVLVKISDMIHEIVSTKKDLNIRKTFDRLISDLIDCHDPSERTMWDSGESSKIKEKFQEFISEMQKINNSFYYLDNLNIK